MNSVLSRNLRRRLSRVRRPDGWDFALCQLGVVRFASAHDCPVNYFVVGILLCRAPAKMAFVDACASPTTMTSLKAWVWRWAVRLFANIPMARYVHAINPNLRVPATMQRKWPDDAVARLCAQCFGQESQSSTVFRDAPRKLTRILGALVVHVAEVLGAERLAATLNRAYSFGSHGGLATGGYDGGGRALPTLPPPQVFRH